MLKWVISVLSFCLLGANPQSQPPSCRVVRQITVQWTESGQQINRLYTIPEKMDKLLIYLRSLDPVPQDAASEEIATPVYRIVVSLSDGSVVCYTQQGLTNFRKGSDSWQVIDPEDAIRLPLILAAIPGDG